MVPRVTAAEMLDVVEERGEAHHSWEWPPLLRAEAQWPVLRGLCPVLRGLCPVLRRHWPAARRPLGRQSRAHPSRLV